MRSHPLAAVLAFLLAGCLAPVADEEAPVLVDCSGHRHATFAVHVPGADGELQRVALDAPRDGGGRAYYQLGSAPDQDITVHMHQSGAEQGSDELGPTQMHYESADTCIDLARTLEAVDITATATTLQVAGQHVSKGSWTTGDGQALHVYVQRVRPEGPCAWQWAEEEAVTVLARPVEDGQSFLVVFGAPGEVQVALMEQEIPVPIERDEPDCT